MTPTRRLVNGEKKLGHEHDMASKYVRAFSLILRSNNILFIVSSHIKTIDFLFFGRYIKLDNNYINLECKLKHTF